MEFLILIGALQISIRVVAQDCVLIWSRSRRSSPVLEVEVKSEQVREVWLRISFIIIVMVL